MSGGSNQITGEQLLSFVERIERLTEEMDNLKADRKEVYGEAKALGFDSKVIRELVTERKKRANDPDGFSEHNELVDVYRTAIEEAEASRAPARARAREPQSSAPDAPFPSARASAGGDGGTNVAAGHPDTAQAAESSPAASSTAAASAPTSGASIPVPDPAADQTGDPQPAAGPSLAPTFTAGDRYAREGWHAYQKGKGRDDHGYLSQERVEGFQRGWDLAERQAQRGQG